MLNLMTREFSRWAARKHISNSELYKALQEVQAGSFDANLGGYLYKKRIRFVGKGKRSSGRTIICFKKNNRAIFIHGFAKNEKANLSKKELFALKAFSKILIDLPREKIEIALERGDFIEVKL